MPKKRTTAAKLTAEFNQHLDSPVSVITVRRYLHIQNIYGRAAIPKPLVTEVNAKHRLQWCYTHKTLAIEKGKEMIWSDKSFLHLFLQQDGCTIELYLYKCIIVIVSFQQSSIEVDLS
ncbi:transposable element Tc1 transposase [Trichonephila clavipes]|nr:transposable element Tc1 transposase [Trichonephila clavipes]